MLQTEFHFECLSTVFWRVIGPPDLLEDLRGKHRGKDVPFSPEAFVAAMPMSLFLCQHEIRGD